jgi:hypothetical protein
MGEKLSADDELEHEVEGDVVLERCKQVDDKRVLQAGQGVSAQPRRVERAKQASP